MAYFGEAAGDLDETPPSGARREFSASHNLSTPSTTVGDMIAPER